MMAFLGAGNIATALALLLEKRARQVTLYSVEESVSETINHQHINQKYLPGFVLPPKICASNSIHDALFGARFVFVAVPSHAVADVLSAARPHISPDAIIVSITKGIDPETFHPLILKQIEILPAELQKNLVILGGPAIANELAAGQATGFVLASKNHEAALAIQRALAHGQVRISLSDDMIGVGLCSGLKNAYGIALGLCDGLHLSVNAKALIYTTALQEMALLVTTAGGKFETVFGLAGAGDLFVTGNSPHSRNRTYGEKLVHAKSSAPETLGLTTVEGISAVNIAREMAHKHKLHLPLLVAINSCLKRSSNFSEPFASYLRGRN